MIRKPRLELTVFAQAWRDTLGRYPDIVIADQIRIASQILWLEADEEGESTVQVTDLKMTPSQATSIKAGKTDAQGRSLEGLVLALYAYSQETGKDAFSFYLERLSTLLNQRGQDLIRGEISPERQEILLNVVKNRRPSEAPEFSRDLILKVEAELQGLPAVPKPVALTIRELLESEFVARGLRPDQPEDRQRFVAACQALGMRISVDDVDAALDGKYVNKTLLGRLRNVIIKDRMTGQLWALEELEHIRDGKLLTT
jgi:hypothetical protein